VYITLPVIILQLQIKIYIIISLVITQYPIAVQYCPLVVKVSVIIKCLLKFETNDAI